MEERHKFLSTQLEDLKATRKDLLSVIKDVDEKILELFDVRLLRRRPRIRDRLLHAVPGRRGRTGAHRPVGHAGHRHRGERPAAGQEGQAAVACCPAGSGR